MTPSYIGNVVEEWGWRGVPMLASEFFYKQRSRSGTPIWDREWDLLIVLDACRPDWLAAIQNEYSFINEIETISSVASHSEGWIQETFSEQYPEELRECLYISGNPYQSEVNAHPKRIENARQYTDYPAPPAHILTDRAVKIARQMTWEKCVVHYMQPHMPFFRCVGESRYNVERIGIGGETEVSYYESYLSGDLDFDEFESIWLDNLRHALDEVDILLDNIDAEKVVITADHGQAQGEHFLWNHRKGVAHPSMRKVPWVETTAEDTQGLDPKTYEKRGHSKQELNEKLGALGYR